tara:strand:+ start:8723 stop:9094 length:372 start_codon:yes stop_codon:yes gene_type:complete
MGVQNLITGKVIKRILKRDEFMINEVSIAVFERDEYGSILRGIDVKTMEQTHAFLELPASEDDVFQFLRAHYRSQKNKVSKKSQKKSPKPKQKHQERKAIEAQRVKEERNKNKYHSKKLRRKN